MRDLGFGDVNIILLGFCFTIGLSLATFLTGGLLGFILALMRVSRSRITRGITMIYVEIVQGIPLLLMLFLVYFGLSVQGVDLPATVAALIGLTIYSASFFAEIWRGCIQAVPAPQWEGSASLGMSRVQQMTYVILPQAMRLSIAPTVGFMVQLIKNTSLAAVIGVVEVTRAGQVVNNATFEPFIVFLAVAVLYYLLCSPLAYASRRLERKMNVRRPAA